MENDELLIDTPWGKKKWKIVRMGLGMYERWKENQERMHIIRVKAAAKGLETKRRNKLLKEQQNESGK